MITSMWMKPGDDLSTALEIRKQVFQQELGLSQTEDQDALDAYSYHLVLLYNDVPAATGRISYDGIGTAKLSDGLVKVLDYKASQLGMQRSKVETISALEPFYMRIGYFPNGQTRQFARMELISMEKETNDGTRENCAHQCTCP